MSTQSIAAIDMARMYKAGVSANKSAAHPTSDGMTLKVSLAFIFPVSALFWDPIARPQWIPPKNDRIVAP
jgi:hypothetical protein